MQMQRHPVHETAMICTVFIVAALYTTNTSQNAMSLKPPQAALERSGSIQVT
jgi:hypothetical protein